LNLHGLPRYHLKVVRLPISPPGRGSQNYIDGGAELSSAFNKRVGRRRHSFNWQLAIGSRQSVLPRPDQLPFIQLLINRTRIQQIIVFTFADDLAAFHHDDFVG
jgi:hypothetical protein